MSPNQIIFGLVRFLHDLATATWIGGLIATAVTVLPASRQVFGPGPDTKRLMAALQRRLSLLVYVSIVVLVVTGILLGRREALYGGLFSFANTYSALLSLKHLVVTLMVAVALYRSLVLGRVAGALSPNQEKLNAALLLLNVVLGVAVLLLSGLASALSSASPTP